MIAALYVETDGCYFGLPGVDPWDVARDARRYAGPHPVVAHPPCERWGRYWGGGPMLHGTPRQKTLGDDAGCFAAALESVRRWGGVLEHPEASHAFARHGLSRPAWGAGWTAALGGWVGCVAQGNYGHRARKLTWLYTSIDSQAEAGEPDRLSRRPTGHRSFGSFGGRMTPADCLSLSLLLGLAIRFARSRRALPPVRIGGPLPEYPPAEVQSGTFARAFRGRT